MTARLEAHGDVKLRVQQAPYAWRYRTDNPNDRRWADATADRRRYLVTAGTQVWLADARTPLEAATACGFGAQRVGDGDVRVREATDADEAALIEVLTAEWWAKQLPFPTDRVKARKVNKPGSGIKPQPIPDLGAARRARARRKVAA